MPNGYLTSIRFAIKLRTASTALRPSESGRFYKFQGKKLAKFMWIVTVVMSFIGAAVAFSGVSAANGAPQEAAAAAMGLACAVIPYCAARAVSEMRIKS